VLYRFEIDMTLRLSSLLDSWVSAEVAGILCRHVEVMDQLRLEEPPWNWGYLTLREWKAMTADEVGPDLSYRLRPSTSRSDWFVKET
jgi:hypothetical protein